ncbi:MAG TPA: TIGR03617 family F420-dependent LLM class oxidoreductase [Mycobacteriales bacterium]|nr:TIGR03617 family F420-dependent LLM class oxidoreductase [Mycobacteriales bacterium]
MLFDTYLGDLAGAGVAAADAEAAGYAGAFTGELTNDPFLPLALAAPATERLTLGTSIVVAFARSPMTVAYTAHDLQRLSGGRFVLGLGSQVKAHITRRFSMPWGRGAEQMRDYVHALHAIWHSWESGERLAFDSEHYRHSLMPPAMVPAPHGFPRPPIYIAGVGDVMTQVAGEVGDGFLCHGFSTPRWIAERTLPALTEGRRRAGKAMDGYVVKASTFLATGTDEEIAKAVDTIKGQIAFYASTPAYKPVLDLHGWGDLGTELTQLSKSGRWSEMPDLVDDDVLDGFAIVAPPADVPRLVRERFDGLVDRLSFIGTSPPADVLHALQESST